MHQRSTPRFLLSPSRDKGNSTYTQEISYMDEERKPSQTATPAVSRLIIMHRKGEGHQIEEKWEDSDPAPHSVDAHPIRTYPTERSQDNNSLDSNEAISSSGIPYPGELAKMKYNWMKWVDRFEVPWSSDIACHGNPPTARASGQTWGDVQQARASQPNFQREGYRCSRSPLSFHCQTLIEPSHLEQKVEGSEEASKNDEDEHGGAHAATQSPISGNSQWQCESHHGKEKFGLQYQGNPKNNGHSEGKAHSPSLPLQPQGFEISQVWIFFARKRKHRLIWALELPSVPIISK